MESAYSRRGLLCTTIGATVASAGCITLPNQTTKGTQDDCGDVDRWEITFGDELNYRSNSGFRLSVATEAVTFGETGSFELKNRSDKTLTTGVKELYTIQREQDDEWVNIFVEPGGFDGAAHDHEPGEGFEWRLEFKQSGIEGSWQSMCGRLRTGQYRFVYFGLPNSEDGDHTAVAVKFTVEDS